MKILPVVIIAISGLLPACSSGQDAGSESAAKEAAEHKRDSLLAAIEAEMASLAESIAVIDSAQAKLDSLFAGMESETWYQEKTAAFQGQRSLIMERVENRRQERAALLGGGG